MDNPMEITDFSSYTPEQMVAVLKEGTAAELEAAGKTLNLQQLYAILDYAAKAHPEVHWKLSPLFVGLPHPLFSQLLLAASPHQLEVLKLEAMTEPLQHHLTLISHEVDHVISQNLDLLDKIATEISLLTIEGKEPRPLKRELKSQLETYHEALNLINKALVLTWNSNRADLIDKLSHAKEQCQRALIHTIGQPKTAFGEAKGLFAQLEESLAAIYGNPSEIESADDEEPALEGLAKLSLWYLHDYQEVGLLPSTRKLDLDPASHTEQERLAYREKLMGEVQENLTKLGLVTVRDLKKAGIYKLEQLKRYIAGHLTNDL
jgi:hypothetical protein